MSPHGRVGYRRCNYVAAFKEIEFEWLRSDPASAAYLRPGGVVTIPYTLIDDEEDKNHLGELSEGTKA